ncbi:hypothetical protein F5Y09DRAFT_326079 [Xylaria sp. FL1042]|nr:hypothetical protein F5Y09DRAFT_326079 [Xylaria sp. FL1042]
MLQISSSNIIKVLSSNIGPISSFTIIIDIQKNKNNINNQLNLRKTHLYFFFAVNHTKMTHASMDQKTRKIEKARSNLPLPEQPPVPSDWQSADARTVNVGSGAVESDISTGPASEAGLREPASTANVDLSKIGRQGKDNLEGPPKDAMAYTYKKK